ENNLLREQDAPDAEPWFSMLETVREFAREQLEAGGAQPAMGQRHAEAMLAFTDRAGAALASPAAQPWMARVEGQLANPRAAFTWLIAHREPELALRLDSQLGVFWRNSGRMAEELAWTTAALALPTTARSTLVRAKALTNVARSHMWQGNLRAPRVLLE